MPTEKTQAEKFKQTAKEVEANEDEEVFKAQLKRVAGAKPKPEKKAD